MSAEKIFNKWVETRPIGTVPQTFDKDYVLNKENAIIFAEAYKNYCVETELINFLNELREYIHESKNDLSTDERESKDFVKIYLNKQLLKQ